MADRFSDIFGKKEGRFSDIFKTPEDAPGSVATLTPTDGQPGVVEPQAAETAGELGEIKGLTFTEAKKVEEIRATGQIPEDQIQSAVKESRAKAPTLTFDTIFAGDGPDLDQLVFDSGIADPSSIAPDEEFFSIEREDRLSDNLRALPERNKGEKIVDFFIGSPETRRQLPGDASRAEKVDFAIKTAAGVPLRTFIKFGKGLLLNTPDIAWSAIKRVVGDELFEDIKDLSLDEAIDQAMGIDPSGFAKALGGLAEFSGRIRTAAGLIGPAPAGAVPQAATTALSFGAAEASRQAAEATQAVIEGRDIEGTGGIEILTDMALGAIFSFASSGVKAVLAKLRPEEASEAFRLLGVKPGASEAEIRKAANNLLFEFHPDKVKSKTSDFKKIMAARAKFDILREAKKEAIEQARKGGKDIIFARRDPKQIAGEVGKPAPEPPKSFKEIFKPEVKPEVKPPVIPKKPEIIPETTKIIPKPAKIIPKKPEVKLPVTPKPKINPEAKTVKVTPEQTAKAQQEARQELGPEATITEKTPEIRKQVSEVIETDFTKAPKVTSARQKSVDEDRKSLGLKEINSTSRRTWETALKQAKKDKIPAKAQRIASEVNETSRPLSDIETAGLTTRMAELKNEHAEIQKEIGKLKDEVDIQTKAAEAERIEQEFDSLSRAVKLNGTQAGRALAAQKLTINQDFDLISVLNRAKTAKTKALSQKESVKFKNLTSELDKANKRIDDLSLEVNEIKAQKFVRRRRTATEFKRMTLIEKDADLARLTAKTNELLKIGCNN